MLLAISAPIMALYTAGAIDYANMLFNDHPTQVAVELAAPAEMAEALKNGVSLTDTPMLALAESYATPNASTQMHFGETRVASNANAGFITLAAY